MDPWPLVGRDAELAVLGRLLAQGRGVVLAGPSGVGKTRLAREATRLVTGWGWASEVVSASANARSIPFGALAHIEHVPSHGQFPSPVAALRRAVLDRAAGAPLLLVVDDAHVLDDATAALVHLLANRGEAVVLATVRSGESGCPDAVVALWKDRLCERLDLQPLSLRETTALLEAVLAGPVDGHTAYRLWEATRGNLLFLSELVAHGTTTGSLRSEHQRWRWAGELAAPPRVAELIARNLDGLDPAVRRTLEVLALGEPLEWEVLCRVAPEAAVGTPTGLVSVERSERRLHARLAHPLTGDVLRRRVAEPLRRRILRDLAGGLRATGCRRRHDVLRVVDWLERADSPITPEELVAAARALAGVDPGRAEHLARRAVAQDGGLDATLTLAQQLMLARRGAEAVACLDRATPSTAQERVALALMRANVMTFAMGAGSEAAAMLDALCDDVADPAVQARLRSHTVPMLLFAGQVPEALRRADALLADTTAERTDRARAAIASVALLATSGRPVAATVRAREAWALVGSGLDDLPFAPGQIAAGSILAHQWAGDLDTADAIARAGYEEGVRRGSDFLRGASALHLGVGLLWRGRVRAATALLAEAVDALEGTDVGLLGWAVDNLRAAGAMAAMPVEAPDPPWRHPLYETERLRLTAAAVAAGGDSRRAAALARSAAEAAASCGLLTQVAFARYDEARYGEPGSAASALASLDVEGTLVPTMAAAAAAMASRDAVALEQAAVAFAEAGYVLFAAEAARVAAAAYDDRGLRARTAAADRSARLLADRCEGARTPLLVTAVALVPGLTRREAEIAELAARGESNAAIARRLGLSVRTVETHLQRAYAKLGIHGRSELAAVFDS